MDQYDKLALEKISHAGEISRENSPSFPIAARTRIIHDESTLE